MLAFVQGALVGPEHDPGEYQKPLKGGEEKQRAASGQYQCEQRVKGGQWLCESYSEQATDRGRIQ